MQQMIRAVDGTRPDLIVIADLLLFHSAPYELGASLDAFLQHALATCRVAALDLYDWDRRVAMLECYGAYRFANSAPLPTGVARLLPSPYLSQGRSTPGRGRYAMMQDAAPLSSAEKAAVRKELGLERGRLVLVLTSPWQHVAQFLDGAQGVGKYFPALMLRLLDLAAEGVGGDVTLVHLGPAGINLPEDVRTLKYRHVPQMLPPLFKRLLGATDLLVSPNCIASSVLRAASMRVPSVALWASRDVTSLESAFRRGGPPCPPDAGSPCPLGEESAPRRALRAYLERACPAYGFLVWPLGLRQALGEIMEGNPYRDIQAYYDVLEPDAAVDGLVQALSSPVFAEEIRHRQQRYFDVLSALDAPEEALRSLLKDANTS